MSEKIPMTAEGLARLEEELRHLKNTARPEAIRAVAQARGHGDFSADADYLSALDRQSFIEGRVSELEGKIARAEVIDVSKLSGKTIKFGAKVTLIDEDTEAKLIFQIVGQDEADVKRGRLAITSPLARALIGKRTGDIVEVNTPNGGKAYEIRRVRFS